AASLASRRNETATPSVLTDVCSCLSRILDRIQEPINHAVIVPCRDRSPTLISEASSIRLVLEEACQGFPESVNVSLFYDFSCPAGFHQSPSCSTYCCGGNNGRPLIQGLVNN